MSKFFDTQEEENRYHIWETGVILDTLTKLGLCTVDKQGRYRITEAGKSALVKYGRNS